MINCFQFCSNFAFKINLRRYIEEYGWYKKMYAHVTAQMKHDGRGTHSSTFRHTLSSF